MRLDELDFELPDDLIAQTPLAQRDASRLLVMRRATGQVEHRAFRELPALLTPGDLLVVNDSRVLPARLLGTKPDTGGRVELLLLREQRADRWECLARPGRRLRRGTQVQFDGVTAVLEQRLGDGLWEVEFNPAGALRPALGHVGQMPLPPYIHARLDDPDRYQTLYAREDGSAAAPTAGLHFTPEVFAALAARGIGRATVTLHVGLDTFRPVSHAIVEEHPMHREAWHVPPETAAAVAETKARGGRVVAVGTTSVRTLETAGQSGSIAAGGGDTELFITPGYPFRVVDAMVTNFHLPRTTLFALVCALAGTDLVRRAYHEAVAERYRMLSFGDATLIL